MFSRQLDLQGRGQKDGLDWNIQQGGVSTGQTFKALGIQIIIEVDNVGKTMEDQVPAPTNSSSQGPDRGETACKGV